MYDKDEEVKALLDLAISLEGLSRNTGKHAGGVLISPSDLTDFTPIACDEFGNGVVSQFDKDDVEAVGLVKFDFLGLRNLTIIDWALQTINRQQVAKGLPPVDINRIPLDDKAAFDLLKAQKTTAVFQLESRGMKDLIRRLQPDVFEDVVALVALFRPGPLQSGMVDDFINRKKGIAKVEYPHPSLEQILKPTYGVIVYQEQVMQIAQVLAGYTLGGADMLRRAMGKKKPEEMAKQRSIFMDGARKLAVDESQATYIFDLMEKFAEYGFNKSHSAAYALVAFQTAWLKAHHPAAFMAAVLSADMDNTDKVVTLLDDCRQLGLQVLPPDINRSDFQFTVDEQNRIIYGLGAVKGAGEAALSVLVEQRRKDGAFKSLADVCKRAGSQKVNRRVLETLIKAGAFDSLGGTRRTLLAFLPEAMRMAEQHLRDQGTGQSDLFGGMFGGVKEDRPESAMPALPEFAEKERLRLEKETLGLYLTGHPLDEYSNRNYWADEQPKLDGIEVIFFNDDPAAVAALRGGQVDLAMRLPTALFESLQSEKKITTISIPSNKFDVIRLRSDRAPGNDPRVIKALKLATDRQVLFQLVQQGYGAVGRDSPIGPMYPAYYSETTPLPERNVEKAKELLAQAGYPNGLKLELHTPDTENRPDLAAAIKNQWSEAGIEVDIKVEPESVYYGDNGWLEVDLGITGWGSRPYPQFYLDVMLVCDAKWNESHYCNPKFDDLAKIAGTSLDEQQRVAAYNEIQKILIEDGPIIIPYFSATNAAINSQFQGFHLNPFPGRTDLRSISR